MEQQHPESGEPSLTQLELLARSADIGDRAFAASALRLRRSDTDSEWVLTLYERIRETARAAHARMHERIRLGQLDQAALLEQLRATAPELRDHLLEEILDVAYPPLQASAQARDVTHHSPSGLAELWFMLEHARLRPGQLLVDLGCGFGKVVLLTALLSGAHAYGIDLDQQLVDHARAAATRLRLERAQFVTGDIRELTLPEADVYYMFIPFLRSAEVIARLQPRAKCRSFLVFSQALELGRLPWLRATGQTCYWLHLYQATADSSAGRAGEGK